MAENELQREPADVSDDSCLSVIHEAAAGEPGVVGVSLDMAGDRLVMDYDPAVLSADKAEEVAGRLALPVIDRHEHCSLRIGRQGGRACESCALVLEDRVRNVPGVRHASASYRSGVLRITYDETVTDRERLLRQVYRLGVAEARPQPAGRMGRLWSWLTVARVEVIFTVVTLVAMVGGWVAGRAEAPALVGWLLYGLAYVTGGAFGLKAGLESLRHRTIDIDLLMILAALGALVVGAPFEGAMLLFLFSLSNVLQEYAMGRTRNAIRELMKLRPTQALVRRQGELVTVEIEQVAVGEVFVLKPGDRVPLDGLVVEGESAMDQASVTGESMPVAKAPGDGVFAGTINQHGSLEVRVTKRAKDSTIARLIEMVEEAQSQKAETQRFIDRAEQYYATGVVVATLLAIGVPILLLAEDFQTAFYRAMTLMVAASPCALVISTPATILSAIGNGARRGVLFKGGAHVEQAAAVRAVAFDKTGTLTVGKPRVTDVRVAPGRPESEVEVLALAAAVQARSEHALARATVEAAAERGQEVAEATAFQALTGRGVRGVVAGRVVHIGNLRYFDEVGCRGLDAVRPDVTALQEEGKTSVVVAAAPEGALPEALGLLAFADVLRPGVAPVMHELKRLGVEHILMLTGDNAQVARRIGREAGVDEIHAELMPEDKLRIIREAAARYGPVAMVGDGVNDAPALAAASLGVAMGAAGTDVALETADIVLMSDDLKNIPYVIALSHKTRNTLVANLGFAFGMILLMVGFILTTHLPLPLAVIGHEGSTVLVSLNGLRLLGFRFRSR